MGALKLQQYQPNDIPPIKINIAFSPLYVRTQKHRFYFFTGGRGSLKTSSITDYLMRRLFMKDQGILFCRYTMVSAEDSIIPEFRKAIQRARAEAYFDIKKTRITNRVTGSFVLFKGVKTSEGLQTAKLKGIEGINIWVLDEMEEFRDEDAFDDIEDSVRGGGQDNMIIMIMNPTDKGHFLYERWFKNTNYKKNYFGFDVTMSNHPDVKHIHTTYHVADALGYLDKTKVRLWEKERSKAIQAQNPLKTKYYRKYIGGWREQAEGVIFENWIEGEFPEYLNSVYGMDYGFTDPLALIRVAVDHDFKKIYLDEIIYKSELSNSQLLRLIEQNTDPNALICTDHNEKRTNRFLQDNNINVVRAIKPKISENIRDIQDYQIVVTPRSTNIKEELNEYKWHDKKAELPIDAWNHAIDASRYGYNELNRYN